MNKMNVIMTILVIAIVCYVGGLMYYEMAVEIENNPDIDEIGGPPVITDVRLLAVAVLGAAFVCGVALKFGG